MKTTNKSLFGAAAYFVIFPLAIKSVYYLPGLQMSKVPMRPEL